MDILISIASPTEARLAAEQGAPWVDLKAPQNGALGAASLQTQQQCLPILQSTPVRSLACGEWYELARHHVPVLPGWHFAKLGLARLTPASESLWQETWQQWAAHLPSGCQPVVVSYADWKTCDGLSLPSALQFATEQNVRHVLVDTFDKGCGGLLRCLEQGNQDSAESQIRQANRQAAKLGIQIVWAGQLTFSQALQLQQWGTQTVGFRSALCDGNRTGPITGPKISQALSLPNVVHGWQTDH